MFTRKFYEFTFKIFMKTKKKMMMMERTSPLTHFRLFTTFLTTLSQFSPHACIYVIYKQFYYIKLNFNNFAMLCTLLGTIVERAVNYIYDTWCTMILSRIILYLNSSTLVSIYKFLAWPELSNNGILWHNS